MADTARRFLVGQIVRSGGTAEKNNGEPDGPYAFNHPLPDDDVVWRGLMAERPRTVQPLYAAPIVQTAPQRED